MKALKSIIPLICLVIAGCGSAKKEFDPAYVEVTNDRAQKIVDEINLGDAEKELAVRDLIAEQYRNLSWIQDNRDREIDEVENGSLSEEKKEEKIEELKKGADEDIAKLHKAYVRSLERELNEEKVVQVKDGMTYGVVPITYNGYLEMLPELTQEEKDTIRKNLEEAREYAMDGGSSDEKHWWFGKYKGKINNYLSDRGYDLNKASKEWQERLKSENKD